MTQPPSAPRPRGRPRNPEKEAAILRAANDLFLSRGFENVSVDAIAEAAGVSKVTIYARFKDKDGLFNAVLRRKCDSFMDADAFELSAARGIKAGLEEIARRFLGLTLDEEAVALYRVMAGQKTDIRMSELFFAQAVGETKDKVVQFFVRETARGRLNVRDPEQASWRFLGALNNQPHMRAVLGLPPIAAGDLERHIQACVDDFLRAHAP